jgi:hypothetical protein
VFLQQPAHTFYRATRALTWWPHHPAAQQKPISACANAAWDPPDPALPPPRNGLTETLRESSWRIRQPPMGLAKDVPPQRHKSLPSRLSFLYFCRREQLHPLPVPTSSQAEYCATIPSTCGDRMNRCSLSS